MRRRGRPGRTLSSGSSLAPRSTIRRRSSCARPASALLSRPEIRVAAIGDSITAGSPWDDDLAIGWPAAAAAADPRLRFTVRAVYGKRTDEIAAWLDEAAAGAEALVVQGGINDIAQGRPVADAAARTCAPMIRRGQELGLRVAVADVLPWNNRWPMPRHPSAS